MRVLIFSVIAMLILLSGCGDSNTVSKFENLNPTNLPEQLGKTPLFPEELKDI